MMHSEVYQGTRSAVNEMLQFQQSSNNTLKAIGKAAAVADIIMKTATSVMNIYNGFSMIPIIGPALGVAGAAAAIAFGGEQLGKVMSAAQGGLITGGRAGFDSVPAMLMPGELVVPTKNYEEVVSAVASSRGGDRGESSDNSGGGSVSEIILTLKGELIEFVEAQLIERRRTGQSALPELV